HRRVATIQLHRGRSRFFTGIRLVFCGSVFWHAVEATKVPAPHNEKQRRTIVIFAVQLMNFLISYFSLSSLFQAAQISKAVNSAAVSIRPARLQRITAHQIEAGKLKTFVRVTYMWTRDIPQHVRLATARCARTRASQHFGLEIRFRPVVPSNGQLVAYLLN